MSHFINFLCIYFIPSINDLFIKTSINVIYQINSPEIIITRVSLSSIFNLISRILYIDASSKTRIFFPIQYWFTIEPSLIQAFFCQNAKNWLLLIRGYFSSSFLILPLGFPLNTKTSDSFLPSLTIHNISVTRTFSWKRISML